MKKLVISILLSIGFAGTAHASGGVEQDKVAHFAVSGAISGTTYAVMRRNGYEKKRAYWSAVAITMGVGLTKEAYDQFNRIEGNKHKMFKLDKNDLAADLLGAMIGPVLVWEF